MAALDLAGSRVATLVGVGAIALWATFATLAAAAGTIPPLELTSLSFGIATLLAVGKWLLCRQNPLPFLRQPLAVWLVGVGGLFGYHALYFVALKLAPPVEASLINYLWPLLIVLLSGFLPGQRLWPRQIVGALIGLVGCVVLVTGGASLHLNPAYAPGYACALACAFIWSGYSVLSRRLGQVPTDTVGGFCVVVALLAWGVHLLTEPTVWPTGARWWPVLGLGIGPVGAAFFAWDHGVKRGDIALLGVLSYATPLLSTALLVAFGRGKPTVALAIACLLIAGGALVAVQRPRA